MGTRVYLPGHVEQHCPSAGGKGFAHGVWHCSWDSVTMPASHRSALQGSSVSVHSVCESWYFPLYIHPGTNRGNYNFPFQIFNVQSQIECEPWHYTTDGAPTGNHFVAFYCNVFEWAQFSGWKLYACLLFGLAFYSGFVNLSLMRGDCPRECTRENKLTFAFLAISMFWLVNEIMAPFDWKIIFAFDESILKQ